MVSNLWLYILLNRQCVLLTLYIYIMYIFIRAAPQSRNRRDARLHLCSNRLNLIYPICEAQGEQSDQTSAGDEEEATEMQVRRRHQPEPTAVDCHLRQLQLTSG